MEIGGVLDRITRARERVARPKVETYSSHVDFFRALERDGIEYFQASTYEKQLMEEAAAHSQIKVGMEYGILMQAEIVEKGKRTIKKYEQVIGSLSNEKVDTGEAKRLKDECCVTLEHRLRMKPEGIEALMTNKQEFQKRVVEARERGVYPKI